MSLIAIWSGEVVIPAFPVSRSKIGKNYISHKLINSLTVQAEIFDTHFPKYKLLKTFLPAPFDEMYIREKGASVRELNKGILALEAPIENSGLPSISLRWVNVAAIEQYFSQPELIQKTWLNIFRFATPPIAPDEQIPSLRPPQIGALHAIAAYFSVNTPLEAATVVLPTGTGKTETMLAWYVYGRLPKLLVLVPSDALRRQITEKFEGLGLLRELSCIPRWTVNPKVACLRSGLSSTEEAEQIINSSNVIVALPNTLTASSPEALQYLISHCSDLIIDEAHHVPANTWQDIRKSFEGKRVLQFTATPFRNDRKHIGGKIIFNYKLSDAQKDNYYRRIRLETVEEYGEDAVRDRAVAERALAILRRDREKGYDHLLMARVQNIHKAEELLVLYQSLAPDLNPIAVHTRLSKSDTELAFDALRNKSNNGSKVVVCVDMLGEGFDLPELKVAAIHDNHKSLAVTLQFIGRFTRQSMNVGDAAVVVNIADVNAERRLEELYAEGADWDHLISRLSETQIEGELKLQSIVESLKTQGNLHEVISLWNLRPSLSAQIYRTKCEDWNPLGFKRAYGSAGHFWHSISEELHTLIVVGYQEFDIKWGQYEDLVETAYDLLVAHWDQANQALFIYCSDYDRMRAFRVAREITSEETELFQGPGIFNVFNNVELPLAKSLGSSRIGAISFTSYFGPNVTEGLASIEKSESALSHIACLGYENGDRVLWGAAEKKAKIWQQKSGSINTWIDWCNRAYQKLLDETDADTNITRDFLRPQPLEKHYANPAITVQWGEYLQSAIADSVFVVFGEDEVPLYLVSLELESSGEDGLIFSLTSDSHFSKYIFKIGPALLRGYSYTLLEGQGVSFRISRYTKRSFEEQMYFDPFIFRYSDGTYSYNNYHIPVQLNAGAYQADQLEIWDWTNVPLNKESMGVEIDEQTIQYFAYQKMASEFDVIFNDDGPGEAADLVCFKDVGPNEIGLCLVHCKNAYDGRPSGDIRNLYVICGQAQKSIAVKHEGIKRLSINLRRRHELWVQRGSSRILKGDLKKLAYFVEKSRKASVSFEVVMVQPGLSKERMTYDIGRLLGTTELFLKRTADAGFRVITSL